MGSAQSSQQLEEEDDDEDEDEEEEDVSNRNSNPSSKKILEQAPEILPCHASASPLSPQLSSLGTPRLGPAIKVWDPYNLLSPHQHLQQQAIADSIDGDQGTTTVEVFLINHGECGITLRPDLVPGRWPAAGLTADGQRQARALAVFLNSQGVRFGAVYTSPLDRARATAVSVCQAVVVNVGSVDD
ncbi:hypothetical protein ACLOJK_002207 [Asimina triloba]